MTKPKRKTKSGSRKKVPAAAETAPDVVHSDDEEEYEGEMEEGVEGEEEGKVPAGDGGKEADEGTSFNNNDK